MTLKRRTDFTDAFAGFNETLVAEVCPTRPTSRRCVRASPPPPSWCERRTFVVAPSACSWRSGTGGAVRDAAAGGGGAAGACKGLPKLRARGRRVFRALSCPFRFVGRRGCWLWGVEVCVGCGSEAVTTVAT